MNTRTRLLIVEDHAILRDGMRTVLADFPEFEIVGEAEDGLDAVRQCETLGPDLVLLDLSLPKQDGIVTLREIKKKCPDAAVLVLTMHQNKQSLEEAMKAGANGYCLKDTPMEELVRAMRAVVEGRQYISREMRCFCEEPSRPDSSGNNKVQTVSLTDREKEVLLLIAKGYTNPQIAADLSISLRTVDAHCTNLRNKLGLHSKQALTAYAFRANLIK